MISLRHLFHIMAITATALTTGYSLNPTTALAIDAKAETPTGEKKEKILYYRDPMSPATSPVPKKSAMGMDYVPVYETGAQDDAGTVRLSPDRIQQLGVQSETAKRRNLAQPVHAVGTVQIDETRQTIIAPRFEGWIEELNANATGLRVQKGDALFTFYSPELTNIESEYHSSEELSTTDHTDKIRSTQAPNGTIKKLQSLAVPQEEVERLKREHTVNYHITLRAPADGTVIKKDAIEGMKFSSGDALYRLVDLSHVWVIVEVYEQDLNRVRMDQTATITLSAFPGKIFEGKVAFNYPDINTDARTAKVRIDLPNPTGELRLDMYADVVIKGMEENNALAVPASAVLSSGEQQVVLIDLGDGRFKPQAVKTGIQGGGYIEILDGLKEDNRVVTSANFLIDSESNLRSALQGFAAQGEKK